MVVQDRFHEENILNSFCEIVHQNSLKYFIANLLKVMDTKAAQTFRTKNRPRVNKLRAIQKRFLQRSTSNSKMDRRRGKITQSD